MSSELGFLPLFFFFFWNSSICASMASSTSCNVCSFRTSQCWSDPMSSIMSRILSSLAAVGLITYTRWKWRYHGLSLRSNRFRRRVVFPPPFLLMIAILQGHVGSGWSSNMTCLSYGARAFVKALCLGISITRCGESKPIIKI